MDTGDVVLRMENVGVRYRLPKGGTRSIKEFVLLAVRGELRFDNFWALRGVNLSLRRGERLGVIGQNGAGKSTLLQLMARVLPPTTGVAIIRGRVAPLLQLGAGFDPELSGRENIYLNGTLLGMRRAEIRRCYAEIVDFAELGEFIEAPLRTYSTGMAARLGFAVATARMPDLLLLDEVLSVGDESFQRKCVARLRAYTERQTTMVLVTHDPAMVLAQCTRAIWINNKVIAADGKPQEVIDQYHSYLTNRDVGNVKAT